MHKHTSVIRLINRTFEICPDRVICWLKSNQTCVLDFDCVWLACILKFDEAGALGSLHAFNVSRNLNRDGRRVPVFYF